MTRSSLRYLLAPLLALGLAWPQDGKSKEVAQRADAGTTEASAPVFEQFEAEELWAHPSRHVGRKVNLTLQVHSQLESWNPFLTRFGPGEFSCLLGWSDSQFPWVQQEFERPRVRVFARRGSAAEWALEEAQRYQRFEVSCEVRAVFGDVPWLEVVGAKPLVRKLGDGVVLHATRALDYMHKELWDVARLELERSMAGALPKPALAELKRLSALCEAELAKPQMQPYREAE